MACLWGRCGLAVKWCQVPFFSRAGGECWLLDTAISLHHVVTRDSIIYDEHMFIKIYHDMRIVTLHFCSQGPFRGTLAMGGIQRVQGPEPSVLLLPCCLQRGCGDFCRNYPWHLGMAGPWGCSQAHETICCERLAVRIVFCLQEDQTIGPSSFCQRSSKIHDAFYSHTNHICTSID